MRSALVTLILFLRLHSVLQFTTTDLIHNDKTQVHESIQYGNISISSTAVPRRKAKNLVALMFSNRTRSNVELPPSNVGTLPACRWLRGYKKQMQQCLHRRGFAKVLQIARKLAVVQCRNLFSFDRWDCTQLQNVMFKKIYRETAFMQAITASALMFSVAKACSDGKLQSCYCLVRPKRDNSKWHGVGCADNTKIARRITRKFLLENINENIKQSAKLKIKQNIYRKNVIIGLETVEKHMKDICVCHGVSASCTLKTCWKIINRNFSTIATSLKAKYNSAVFYKQGWNKNEIVDNLLYMEASHSFCNATRGRRCKDYSHCATLCCGRGSYEQSVVVGGRCNCKWNDGFVIGCDWCTTNEIHFICK